MQDNPIIEYRQNVSSSGPPAPFRNGSESPILEGGIQHNLRDHLSIIFKHKFKILICFILAILLAPVAFYIIPKFRPPLYEAKSVIMVKSGREYNDPELGTKKTPISFGRGEIFTSEMMILRGRELKERIISTLSLEKLFPDVVAHPQNNLSPLEAALIVFDKNLNIKEVRNSNFIEISFLNKDPEIAAKVTNLLVQYYFEKRREILSDPKSIFFLEKKLAEYRQKLRESEERLESFRRNYGFYSFEKQMDFLQKKRFQLEESITTDQGQIQELKQTVITLTNRLKTPQEIIDTTPTEQNAPENEELRGLKTRLVNLLQKEQEFLGKYTETNFNVVNVRREIQAMQELIKKTEATSRKTKQVGNVTGNLVRQTLEQEKISAEANLKSCLERIEANKLELKNLDKQIQDLGSQEKRLKELHREQEHNEQYYKVYASKVEELRISEDISRQEMPSVSVLQSAIPPAKPINENYHLLLYFAIAAILGLATGVGLSYLLESMSQGLRTPEGVEARLGLPVLATVPFRA